MSWMRFFCLAGITASLLVCSCRGEEPAVTDQAVSEQETSPPAAAEEVPNEAPDASTAGAAAAVQEKAVPEPKLSEALRSTLAAMPSGARSAENPFAGQVELLSKGKDEFMTLCSQCHGDEGEGDGPAAKRAGVDPTNLLVSKLTVGERFEVIKDGVTGTLMPSFGAALSSRQMWSLVSFLESLRPDPPVAKDPPPDSAQ